MLESKERPEYGSKINLARDLPTGSSVEIRDNFRAGLYTLEVQSVSSEPGSIETERETLYREEHPAVLPPLFNPNLQRKERKLIEFLEDHGIWASDRPSSDYSERY